jgi:uncharacterized protein involved in exopolysaccharide biosynthesis
MADQDVANPAGGHNGRNGHQETRERSSTVRDYVSIVFRRRKLLTGTFLATFLGALLVTVLVMNYRYQPEMKILVQYQRYNPLVTPGQTNEQGQTINAQDVNPAEVASEVSLLTDEDLLREVVLACKLQDRPTWRDYLLPFVHYTQDQRIAFAVRSLQKGLSVQNETNTNLVDVDYVTYWDADLGPRVLNTLGRLYLQKHLQIHSPPGALDFFQKETAQYQQGLADSEARLASYDRGHNAVSAALERDAAVGKLTDFYASLGQTRADIAQTRERIRDLEKQLAHTPSRMDTQQQTTDASLLLEQEKSTLLNLQLKRTELLTKFDPSYPLVQEVEKQIAEARQAVAEAEKSPTQSKTTDNDPTHELIRQELAKAKADLATFEGREAGTLKVIKDVQAQAIELDQKALDQKGLLREAKADEDNYLLYLHKREDARIAQALNATQIANVSIAQVAITPLLPFYSPWLCGFLGFVLSVMVSVGSAVVAEYMDPSFQTPDQVMEYLDVPVFASIPKNGG